MIASAERNAPKSTSNTSERTNLSAMRRPEEEESCITPVWDSPSTMQARTYGLILTRGPNGCSSMKVSLDGVVCSVLEGHFIPKLYLFPPASVYLEID
jgi:hypothetical protein